MPSLPTHLPSGSPCRPPQAEEEATGDCQAVALTLWAQPRGGPQALFIHSFSLSLSLSLWLREQAQWLGKFRWRAQPCLPGLLPNPGCCLGSSCHSQPLNPWKPALCAPCPCLGLRNSHPFQSRGVGGWGSKGGQGKGCEACPSHHPSPLSTEQSHGFWYPPVPFLLQAPFSRVVELHGGLGRAGVPERASTWHVSEATETLPQCILPHRAGFQGFFKAAGENLATVEKLTRSFHAVYMVLFLSFLPLKRKTQKNVSDLCT